MASERIESTHEFVMLLDHILNTVLVHRNISFLAITPTSQTKRSNSVRHVSAVEPHFDAGEADQIGPRGYKMIDEEFFLTPH